MASAVRLAQAGHRKAYAKLKVIDQSGEFGARLCGACFLISRAA
jgi:hypothetical protein